MRRRPPPRRRPWGGIVTLTVMGMAVGAWAVASSPVFDIREVRVKGNQHLSESEVERLAGIGSDANLLTLPARRVARSLARNPWVLWVDVGRSFPSTVVLTIEERSPVAWVRQPDGVAVVAGDGMVLSRRVGAPKPPRGLVAIGRSHDPLRPGARLTGLEGQLAVAASLPPDLRGKAIRASLKGGEILLELADGTEVLYGQPGSLPQKNAALAKVLRWARNQGAQLAYVDLRVPGNPAVRLGGG
jgi:cell division protein FtsQ